MSARVAVLRFLCPCQGWSDVGGGYLWCIGVTSVALSLPKALSERTRPCATCPGSRDQSKVDAFALDRPVREPRYYSWAQGYPAVAD